MDPTRFDILTRSLAAPKTRRGLLAGLASLVVGARVAAAQSACPPEQSRNTKGQCSCPAGTDACPDGCFNRRKDPANCGRCGNVCLPGEICQKGECTCPRGAICGCPAGEVLCNGTCTDPDVFHSDTGNCGACGTVCGNGGDDCRVPRCDEGVCVTDPLDCEDGNPCTSNRCNGFCVTGFLSGGTCSTAEVENGTCASGTCVPIATTTSTTTAAPTTTTPAPTSTTTTTFVPTTTTTTTTAPTTTTAMPTTTSTTLQPTTTTTLEPTTTTTTTVGPCVPDCAGRCGGAGDGCGGTCTSGCPVFECNTSQCYEGVCYNNPSGVGGVSCNGGAGVCDTLGNCETCASGVVCSGTCCVNTGDGPLLCSGTGPLCTCYRAVPIDNGIQYFPYFC